VNHTTERIKKLHARGMSDEQIARKIGRPDDIARVRKVTESEVKDGPSNEQSEGEKAGRTEDHG